MIDMGSKLVLIVPEILIFIGAVVVSVLGLSRSKVIRDAVPGVTAAFLVAAAVAVQLVWTPDHVAAAGLLMPYLGRFVKTMVAVIGLALVACGAGSVDRRLEEAVARGHTPFDPIRVIRGEFHAFLLLSLAGTMLLCNAPDLIWLFLAMELASLPTYVMVAMSRGNRRAQEAAVKYFFLGAMSAAIVLYGFALIYGSTGSLKLLEITDAFRMQVQLHGSIDGMALVGVAMVILGSCFKIAAVPMHFYAPDVYEGASLPVTAFLGFVPKTAGFVLLMMVLTTVGWKGHLGIDASGDLRDGLPQPILALLWMVAVMTMSLGNVGALLQKNVKRMMAYSSIANSGYMLIGLIVGPRLGGLDATLFFLLVYGIMNTAVLAGLAAVERNGDEVDTFDDLSGLRVRHPMVAAMIAAGAASLIGLPPLLGFWGKLNIFIAGLNPGVDAGHVRLVVIAAINSAVSAFYYLRLVGSPLVGVADSRSEAVRSVPSVWPKIAAIACGFGVLVLPLAASALVESAAVATNDRSEVAIPATAGNPRADAAEPATTPSGVVPLSSRLRP